MDKTTTNLQEISHFSKDAFTWWNPLGPFKPLHQMNPVRLSFIMRTIQQFLNIKNDFSSLNILDVGCGGGLLCEPLARLGAQVTGIDASPEAIEVARQHAQEQDLSITYHLGSIEQLAKQEAAFDILIASEIIEHVDNVPLFIESCHRLTKPGGLLIFSTLNRTLKSFGLGIFAAEYLLRLIPRGTHSWHKFLKPSELTTYLRSYGRPLVSMSGLSYNPVTGIWSEISNLDMNYICAFGARD